PRPSSTFLVPIATPPPAAHATLFRSTDSGSSSTDHITSDTTLILSGTAEANSTVTLTRVGTGVIGTTTADGSGNWSFDYTGTSLAEGSYSFTATATDAAGNTSGSSATFGVTIDTTAPGARAFTVTIDITAPAAPTITGIIADSGSSSVDHVTNDQTLILQGTAEPSSAVTITRSDAGVIGTATADAAGNWTFDYTATTLAEGT